ncbi:hypothetical protein JMJ55_15525 [Belnapia sp. T6]|uniref:Uncharacterized protein n=1 Tax=Belnapia mucosa TaxID=2804532 RepID=A0ABS1V4Y1_9PROT|nr:hypothetical protein [Belnapia mucosa]MBL6456746.1 hypothetical protein [Belnapia mucosa]
MPAELRAGAAYAAAMFGLGALLGPVRELVLAPRFGPTAAAALEAVPMLIGMAILAPVLARRFGRPAPLGMGAAGLVLLVLAESALDLAVRGHLLWAERATTPAGWIGLGLLAAFGAMPALRLR